MSSSLIHGRRAARELALLILFQMEDRQGKIPTTLPDDFSMAHAMRSSIQSLTNNAQDQLEQGVEFFKKLYDKVADFEQDHPTNLNSSLTTPNKPVPMPFTRDTMQQAKDALYAIELVWEALHVPQLLAHANLPEVSAFCQELVEITLKNSGHLDEVIGHYSQDWKTNRLVKMDRLVLRLALAELLFGKGVDQAIAINEAVDLAKQYSQDDSYKFINGLLGRVAQQVSSGEPLLAPLTAEA
jgi:transcription antitermination protein NusB